MPRWNSLVKRALTQRRRKPPSRYAVSTTSVTVNEGVTVYFNVTTLNVPDDTTLYYTLNGSVNSADIFNGATSGSFIVTNGQANVSVGIAYDGSTSSEGIETVGIQIRTNSNIGNVVATSGLVNINDSSVGYAAELLMVGGGGGGGGGAHGGGGGAGGVLNISYNFDLAQSYTVIVGGGGAGGGKPGRGSNGGNSYVYIVVDPSYQTASAIGGGAGGAETAYIFDRFGGAGGSGGGCAGVFYSGCGGGVYLIPTGGAGTAGPPRQGYDGGSTLSCYTSISTKSSGGGGGAGGAGANAGSGTGVVSAGGVGTNAYSGWASATSSGSGGYFAGGGGGSKEGGGSGNTGGAGGAGGGGYGSGGTGVSGLSNTGGGGGGGERASGSTGGGGGGSGIVIIRYPGSQRANGGTVYSSGGYTYHKFLTSDTFTPL